MPRAKRKVEPIIPRDNVIPFVPRTPTRTVLIPQGLAKPDEVGTIVVRGESLAGIGIEDGDVLVFRQNYVTAEILPDSLCVVRVLSTDELLAKYIVRDEKDGITLKSFHSDYPDRTFHADDLDIIGIAFAFQKTADRFGRFARVKAA